MQLNILLTEDDIMDLIEDSLTNRFPDSGITRDMIRVQVKSKQNYKAEWEVAAFRATIEGSIS